MTFDVSLLLCREGFRTTETFILLGNIGCNVPRTAFRERLRERLLRPSNAHEPLMNDFKAVDPLHP